MEGKYAVSDDFLLPPHFIKAANASFCEIQQLGPQTRSYLFYSEFIFPKASTSNKVISVYWLTVE